MSLIDIPLDICIFGSIHSFVDGEYEYVAWNLDEEYFGPIYHNSLENEYLYITVEDELIEWQISNDSLSSTQSYSHCRMHKDVLDQFDIRKCENWETDIDQNINHIIWHQEPWLTASDCNHNASEEDASITFGFHIYKKLGWDEMVMSLTLFWEGSKYKCTIYPTYYDTYYSCNTLLNSVQCDESMSDSHNHMNIMEDIDYALYIDVFKDDEQEDDDWRNNINDESFGIDSIIFKHDSQCCGSYQ